MESGRLREDVEQFVFFVELFLNCPRYLPGAGLLVEGAGLGGPGDSWGRGLRWEAGRGRVVHSGEVGGALAPRGKSTVS